MKGKSCLYRAGDVPQLPLFWSIIASSVEILHHWVLLHCLRQSALGSNHSYPVLVKLLCYLDYTAICLSFFDKTLYIARIAQDHAMRQAPCCSAGATGQPSIRQLSEAVETVSLLLPQISGQPLLTTVAAILVIFAWLHCSRRLQILVALPRQAQVAAVVLWISCVSFVVTKHWSLRTYSGLRQEGVTVTVMSISFVVEQRHST